MQLSSQLAQFRGVKLEGARCKAADDISVNLGTIPEKISFWEDLEGIVSDDGPKGHIYFRLGTLLLLEGEPSQAISSLEKAYEQDKQFHRPDVPAESMSACRVLCLLHDFLKWAGTQPQKHWKDWATQPAFRHILINVLFDIYDRSLKPSISHLAHTQQNFREAIVDENLRLFCRENYLLTLRLLEFFDCSPNPLRLHGYATARAVATLLGGALEAVLLDQLQQKHIIDLRKSNAYTSSVENRASIKNAKVNKPKQMLGELILQCYEKGIVQQASKLDVFCVLIQYFRNLVHGNVSGRRQFVFNMNNAKSLKNVFDFALSELLQRRRQR